MSLFVPSSLYEFRSNMSSVHLLSWISLYTESWSGATCLAPYACTSAFLDHGSLPNTVLLLQNTVNAPKRTPSHLIPSLISTRFLLCWFHRSWNFLGCNHVGGRSRVRSSCAVLGFFPSLLSWGISFQFLLPIEAAEINGSTNCRIIRKWDCKSFLSAY